MKEITVKLSSLWFSVVAIVITAMLCATMIFVSMQYSQTQKDISNTQIQATKESAKQVSDGLRDIGQGVCQTSSRTFNVCNIKE